MADRPLHVPERMDCYTENDPHGHGVCKAFSSFKQMNELNGVSCFRKGVPCFRMPIEFIVPFYAKGGVI